MSYIGITGFSSFDEVNSIVRFFDSIKSTDYKLMVGLLVSQKTLDGLEASNPARYPPRDKFNEIFKRISYNQLNIVHFNSRKNNLAEQLFKVHDLIKDFDGFQLNIPWPDLEEIKKYRDKFPDKKLIFQLSSRSLVKSENQSIIDWFSVLEALAKHSEYFDYLIYDMSGGKGKAIDLPLTLSAFKLIKEQIPKFELVVAGGLNPENLDQLHPLLEFFPELSWDVESGVRDDNDHLDLEKSKRYIRKSFELLKNV